MARIINESFEGTGYEESWSETIETGCTLDEDVSIPETAPPGAGNQCLKAIVVDSTDNNAYATQTKSNQSTSYVRFYFYLGAEGYNNGQLASICNLQDSGVGYAAKIEMGQIAGVFGLRYTYRSSGVDNSTALIAVSLSQWHLIEFKYDITGTAWEWRIDGDVQHSGSLSAAIRTPDSLVIGIIVSTGSTGATIYEDLIVWDDAAWVGPSGSAPTGTIYGPLVGPMGGPI